MSENTQNENTLNEDVVREDAETDFEIDLGELEPEAEETGLNLDFGDDEQPAEDSELNLDFDAPAVEGDDAADAESDEDAPEDADAALEAALEELRLDLRSKPGEWYVLHTYSGMENKVKQNLDARANTLDQTDYIFETIVPTETVVEIRNGTPKQVTRVVLPGYVLVRMEMTEDSWATVRHTPSVTGFVGHAQDPVPLSLTEVENMLLPSIKAKVAAENQGKPSPKTKKKVEVMDFEVGDSVQVIEGPFAGVHASITEINPNAQRLKALVEILGRETPVDLTFQQIEKL
ncbi:transcription termination/antitermination protein NusG [Aestuariimicrobium sp. p3-SID1156]|uniref:transcription termination/antitermination protein NusG n=1 Tax=Aestuariimicrobium sp. p3-SID1156 TaxID=2916038 RepID=UPI00223C477D|nr:transcription termination/antitermination protein NusG [Aestuariimicrobium sp. p3-SID1156]MCT1458809.1 transcription termination/antitermination protein NusG [Aestuariimicrobium sp. p3-SID1156]